MIKYTREVITHFLCLKCSKWFSISEFETVGIAVVCPHCSEKAVPEKME